MNKKLVDVLFVGMIILNIVFILFTTSYLLKNKEAFFDQPFVYGAERMGLEGCSAMCYNNDSQKPIYLYWNSTHFIQGQSQGNFVAFPIQTEGG